MNDNDTITLHRGVDNTHYFRVRNRDMKRQNVSGLVVMAKIVDRMNGDKVFEKRLIQTDDDQFSLNVLEGELLEVEPGYYEMVLESMEMFDTNNYEHNPRQPLYRDLNGEIRFEVEVTGHADSTPRPSREEIKPFEKWLPTLKDGVTVYSSSAIPCNALRNHRNSLHTMSIQADNFSGTLEIYGTLELDPPPDNNSWFPVTVQDLPVNEIQMDKFTGTHAFNVVGNLYWVKYILKGDLDNLGTFDKLTWRS